MAKVRQSLTLTITLTLTLTLYRSGPSLWRADTVCPSCVTGDAARRAGKSQCPTDPRGEGARTREGARTPAPGDAAQEQPSGAGQQRHVRADSRRSRLHRLPDAGPRDADHVERPARQLSAVRRRPVLLQPADQPARHRQLVAERRGVHDVQHAIQTGARRHFYPSRIHYSTLLNGFRVLVLYFSLSFLSFLCVRTVD